MRTLYARAIWLRNCGRFTHVSSDFGSQYHTYTFVTSEALYASLTRGATWCHQGRFVDRETDAKKSTCPDYFRCDYDIAKKPIWFTPGVFVDEHMRPLGKQRKIVDAHDFNVISEGYPSTSKTPIGSDRDFRVPTFGRIETLLPGNMLVAYGFSYDLEELNTLKKNQIFLLGKKRTMFQITELSDIVEGSHKRGCCDTGWWIEVPPIYGGKFQQFEILGATMRYLILRGMTKDCLDYIEFEFSDGKTIRLPYFYLDTVPLNDSS